MATFELVRVVKAEVPRFENLSDRFWTQVGKIISASILTNIVTGKQASGASLKRNKQSTLERKRRLGRGQRSLVDALHRFVQGAQKSWRLKIIPNGVEVGPATEELDRLNRYVQQKGYTGYLGISKEAAEKIKLALRDEVRRQFRKASR